jgi:fucose permease
LNFTRDRFTWLAYFMLAFYAYLQSTLGPLIPFLRDELHMNYTISGLHLSAFALGMMMAGLTADRAARRFGRYRVFWFGGAGMVVGALLLALGQSPPVTILSVLFMSVTGSYLLVMIQAALADQHGEQRAIALTEANVAASIAASLAPIFVGQGQALGLGWRIGLYIGMMAWLAAVTTSRRIPLPEAGAGGSVDDFPARLPRAFWAYWFVVVLSVSMEWCMIFWAADFLEKIASLNKDTAATSISLFFLATVVGRATGSRLSRTIDTGKLLLGALAIVVIGFPMFWLSRQPLLNVTGLFLCGLGIANLFPLTLSAASHVGTAQPNRASARVSLAGGLAILVAPQTLAGLADQIGIWNAYAIMPFLLVGAIIVTLIANRMAAQEFPAQAQSLHGAEFENAKL